MKILLANPRGFCAGVNMAIECVERVLDASGPPVYVYHEIVHNKHVVDRFIKRGVVFVNSLEEVPRGSIVVYSAHGVSPEIRSQATRRELIQVDATCPLVSKVHIEAVRFAKQKFSIILIGHRNHDEVVGTLGEAPDSIHVVASVKEAQALAIPAGHRIAYLTQTTLSLDDAQEIIAALERKFPQIQGPAKQDICYATTNRQNVIRQLAGECDVVLVVGSRNSSNSNRLVDIAANRDVPAYLIDDVSDLDHGWLAGARCVLITAGASAPEDLVQAVIGELVSRYNATVEERQTADEDVHFELPQSLRKLRVLRA